MATTTGELLVEMSTLTTGTAMEHFQNISHGGGEGTIIEIYDSEIHDAEIN